MAGFMLSPGVQVVEKDFTSIIPAVATSTGAYAGVFKWGPVMDPIKVSSENELVNIFGGPNDDIAQSFFSAANYLSYSKELYVNRISTSGQRNAVSLKTGGITSTNITAPGANYETGATVTVGAPDIPGGLQAVITATITAGELVTLTIVEPGSGYTNNPTITIVPAVGDLTGSGATATATITVGGIVINNEDHYTTTYSNGGGVVGEFAAKYPGSMGNSLLVSVADSATFATWNYKAEFDTVPDTGELHVVVVDENGVITGTTGTILEKFAYLSKASNGKKADGSSSYYHLVLNTKSKWVYVMDHPTGTNWGGEVGTVFDNLTEPLESSLSGGVDDFSATDGNKMTAFVVYDDFEKYDISLLIAGKASTTVAEFIISNIAEVRKDCVAFISPENITTGEPIVGSSTDLAQDAVDYRDELPSSSYAFLDSGYKYQYDRYNDRYRWVPLNADVAGLCARTDSTNDPWWSPSGLIRGQIKNVVKLAYNPNPTARDTLYKAGINPVVSFPGLGSVLYGDKTLLSKPSAFDRINVRRLFIVLEKAIAVAAKYQLFNFNDQFTRAQFKSMVEPFLRDVQGRRGITNFYVKCDEENNTPEVIDNNNFVCDIFIAPTRSINFITLNFVATRTGVNFKELGA